MSQLSIKPFVPSEVCLQCDGCCRFKERESAWAARYSNDELLNFHRSGLAQEILGRVSSEGKIKSKPCGDEHLCSFYNLGDRTCGIYSSRPFECQLYPFVMTKKNDVEVMSVHLNCPFVQEKINTEYFSHYVEYLKEVFSKAGMTQYVRRNPEVVGEYSSYQNELEYLFTLKTQPPSTPPADLLAKKDWIESYLKECQPPLTAFSFINLLIWSRFFEFTFEVIDAHLCIFARNDAGSFLYLPPVGPQLTMDIVQQCFMKLDAVNRSRAISRIENISLSQKDFFADSKFSLAPKAHEFIYWRKDLVDLKGNTYKSKRSSYNQFAKREGYQFLPYDVSRLEGCLQLHAQWMQNRLSKNSDPIYQQLLTENQVVHGLALKYFQDLGLCGRVVVIEGEIKGYTVGYSLNKDVFCVLCEVTDLSVPGLSAFIFSRFCAEAELAAYSFINVMDDFELKNIEQTKQSFRPVLLVPSYIASRKEMG